MPSSVVSAFYNKGSYISGNSRMFQRIQNCQQSQKQVLLLVLNCAKMSTKASTKATLRKQIAEKLKNLTTEEKQRQSCIVLEKLFNLQSFKNSKRISTYLSTENEIDTEPIVRNIIENGKECFVPRYSKSCMEMVKLNSMEDWKTLPLTNWGIKQPSLKEEREDALKTGGLDFVVVPGVAFTLDGLRLGHGGGYYDTFLSKIQTLQDKPPETVALAFSEQIVDDLPVHEHDIKIQTVLYPN